MRPPGLADLQHPRRRRHLLQPVLDLDRFADAEIAAGEDVGALQVEEQEHLGGPAAEPADGDDLLDYLLVLELSETVELELAAEHVRGEVADVFGLAPGEPAGAQVLLACLQQLLGAGSAAAEEVKNPQVDRPRRFGRELLADDRPQERPVGVGGSLLLAAPQPRRQVDLPDPLDQRRHRRVGGAQRFARFRAHRPCHRGLRFSPKARMPSRKSSDSKQDSRRATSPASCCSVSCATSLSRSIACLLPRIESGAFPAIAAASATDSRSSSSSATISLTRPIASARAASKLRPVRKSSLVRGSPTTSRNLRRPVWP